MCHDTISCSGRTLDRPESSFKTNVLQLDFGNLHGCVVLPVPALNLVLVGLLELQNGQLLLPPRLPAPRSMRMVSPGATRYCFPPVCITAYITPPITINANSNYTCRPPPPSTHQFPRIRHEVGSAALTS